MTTGEKIAKHRKESNMTQEQLAELLEVSRQSVSKWESDLAFPETDKLLRLSRLFDCTVDYLLKAEAKDPKHTANEPVPKSLSFKLTSFEYTSQRKIGKLPLVHVCFKPKKAARGIIAVGFRSCGILSVGLLSAGILSFGVLSLGLLALGSFTLGLFSLAAISVGIFALGGIALGLLAVGGVAIGAFACGGLAIGGYFAFGDFANAQVAIGISHASGSYWGYCSEALDYSKTEVMEMLRTVTPPALRWLINLMQIFL